MILQDYGQANPNNPPVKLYFYHVDHLGTPRVITDVAGELVEEHKYLPFGEEPNAADSMNSHQFTGHERDGETGMDYMLARRQEDHLLAAAASRADGRRQPPLPRLHLRPR